MNAMDTATAARREIEELVYRWGMARDADDWDALDGCFHADGNIHISWISASKTEFVSRSRDMAARRQKGAHMKHVITGPRRECQGQRGISSTNAILYIRDSIGDVWFDIESHIRFFDRTECRDGKWRILERTALYDKDRIDTVYHGHSLKDLPGMADLAQFQSEAQYLCWWLKSKGMQPLKDLITVYSDDERLLRVRFAEWLDSDPKNPNT